MIDLIQTPIGNFREVARAPLPLEDRWLFECPGCGIWAYMDDDQWNGRVSVDHSNSDVKPDCTYHETHDYRSALREALGREP